MVPDSIKRLYPQVFCETSPVEQSACEYFCTVMVITVADKLVNKIIVTVSVPMCKVKIIWRFVARK